MPISDWNDLCTQTIVWKPLASRDNYGLPVYGSSQTFRGRRVNKLQRVGSNHPVKVASGGGVRGGGAEVMAESTIWILGLPDIGYDDQVYVQGDTKIPPIVGIERYPDENGDLFVKVMMGGFTG